MSEKSEINKLPTIERVFDLLDAWRHLPAYQLERRADIFFALFLPEVLEKHFNIALNPILVPEFPIRKSNVNRTECADEGQPRHRVLTCPSSRAWIIVVAVVTPTETEPKLRRAGNARL